MTIHTVLKGETIYQIAKNNGCSIAELMALNKGINPNAMQIGQKLAMPAKVASQQGQREFKATNENQNTNISEYKIQSGDNLSIIAKKYGFTVAQLKAANNLQSDTIKAGQKLIIPPKTQTTATNPQKTSSMTKQAQSKTTVTNSEKATYNKKLTASTTAKIRGINNTPNPQAQKNLESLIENTVVPIAKLLEKNGIKIVISSGYRSSELNKRVGGKPDSQHIKGQAFDFQVQPNNYATRQKAFELVKNSGIVVDQMLAEYNSKGTQWFHVSYRNDGKNRKQFIENYKA